MRPPSLAAAVAVVLASGVAARADRLVPAIAPDDGGGATPQITRRLGHRGQLGLAGQLVSGSRFIKPYDGEFCGATATDTPGGNATACFSRVPITLDLAASYGLTPKLELLLEVRLGLEHDFGASASAAGGPRLRHYAPGVRFFFNPDEKLKFFSTAQLAIDATGYQDSRGQDLGVDLAARNANGLQLDFRDGYGAYAFFAEEVQAGRWLEVGLELGVGFQGRLPTIR